MTSSSKYCNYFIFYHLLSPVNGVQLNCDMQVTTPNNEGRKSAAMRADHCVCVLHLISFHPHHRRADVMYSLCASQMNIWHLILDHYKLCSDQDS